MVDYDFYVNSYLGSTIPEKQFSGMAARAQDILRRFQRIYQVKVAGQQAEAMALCAMAETLYSRETCRSGLTSAAVGNVSVHYDRAEKQSLMMELYDQASIYLDIYRGVRT